jgi:aquaporin Z
MAAPGRPAERSSSGRRRRERPGSGPDLANEHDLTPREAGRRLLAEFVGTFALTAVAAGTDMAATISGGEVDRVARALAPGMLVMAFIYAFGDASGAHFNPAVTLAFAVKRLFPWRWVALYWVAQFAGSITAAVVLLGLLGDVGHLGASVPLIAPASAVLLEVLLTAILVTVIVGTADRFRIVGTESAIAVGATIALCGLFGGALSGASMNPARSLGPALVGGDFANAWIYVLGPVAGASLAVVVTMLLHGFAPRDDKQVEAAEGSQVMEPEGSGPNDRPTGAEERPQPRSRGRLAGAK